ncbi:hypothetical protein Tco_0792397 [Tanacetum coccineum]
MVAVVVDVVMVPWGWQWGGGGVVAGDGEWRLAESGVVDRIDRLMGSIFGLSRKSFPAAASGGGGGRRRCLEMANCARESVWERVRFDEKGQRRTREKYRGESIKMWIFYTRGYARSLYLNAGMGLSNKDARRYIDALKGMSMVVSETVKKTKIGKENDDTKCDVSEVVITEDEMVGDVIRMGFIGEAKNTNFIEHGLRTLDMEDTEKSNTLLSRSNGRLTWLIDCREC